MATGLESYYIDNNQYPAMTLVYTESVDAQFFTTTPPPTGKFCRVFRTRLNNSLGMMTTPIAYLSSHFPDAFADTKGTTFRYFTDTNGWILSSWGPDTDQREGGDLLMFGGEITLGRPDGSEGTAFRVIDQGSIETIYDSRISHPSTNYVTGISGGLIAGQSNGTENGTSRTNAYTYDPTNGTVSEGDVWRVKQ